MDDVSSCEDSAEEYKESGARCDFHRDHSPPAFLVTSKSESSMLAVKVGAIRSYSVRSSRADVDRQRLDHS
jgi:hypothetical protein